MLPNSKSSYTVYFSSKRPEKSQLKSNSIVIYPESSNWNDFSYRIRCQLIAKLNSPLPNKYIELDIFLAFLADTKTKEDYSGLAHWLKSRSTSGHQLIPAVEASKFICMLPTIGDYRKVVRAMGVQGAEHLLEAIHDIVTLKNTDKSNSFNNIQNSKAFSLGFMRNSESFFAFHNADSILKGLSNENFDAISNNLELTFQLPNFATPHKLSFRFTGSEIIPKRINILIGKNGLGKSQALNRFCRCALQHKNEKAILRDESNDSSRPMINRLIAIGTPGETSNTFPGEHLETQKLHYRRVNLTRGSKVKLTQNLSNSLIQLVRSEDYIGEQSRWEIFLESIDKAIDSNQIHILLKDGTSCPLKKLPGYSGEQHSLELWTNIDSSKEPIFVHNDHKAPLSSGQLTFFKFAVYCSLMIENGCFVLMDEPETHLHPNLISDFVELLDTLLEKTGSYAIIATHSAYFVREVSREQVHIFKSDGTNISIEQPRLKTFGADIDSISEFIFEDNISNRMLKRIAEKAVNKSYDEIKNEIGSEISYQALMSLREMKRGLNE